MMNPRSSDDYAEFFGPHLGRVLLRARKEKRVSQVALANTLDVNDATLRRIEAGHGPMRSKHVKANGAQAVQMFPVGKSLFFLTGYNQLWVSRLDAPRASLGE
jgi:transcriptional regulator with XRE-family HTH domain